MKKLILCLSLFCLTTTISFSQALVLEKGSFSKHKFEIITADRLPEDMVILRFGTLQKRADLNSIADLSKKDIALMKKHAKWENSNTVFVDFKQSLPLRDNSGTNYKEVLLSFYVVSKTYTIDALHLSPSQANLDRMHKFSKTKSVDPGSSNQ